METTDLAKKLFVRYVAQGTLWKMDSVFQLSMEIFDTKESKVVHTRRWQTSWTDLSTIKSDLSNNILKTLKIKILQDPEKHILESNPKAYAYYLEAKHKYEKREDKDDTEIARGLLDRAIKLDDNFTEAKLLLGDTYQTVGDYDKAMSIYNSALDQAQNLEDKNAIGDALFGIGYIHYSKGEHDQAYEYYKRVLVIVEELGDMGRIRKILITIGNLYQDKGDDDEALDFFQRALRIDEELEYRNYATLNSIGIIHGKRGEVDQSLDYFKRSLAICEEQDDYDGLGAVIGNIGLLHFVRREYDEAIEHLNRGISINQELGNKYAIGNDLNNIGFVLIAMGKYDQAIEYQKRGLKVSEELGNKEGMARSLSGIADNYSNIGEYDQALNYLNLGLKISEEQGYKRIINSYLFLFGEVYLLKGEYDQALDYYTRALENIEELGDEYRLEMITNPFLASKYLGKEYDIQEIHKLIEKTDEIDYKTNFSLYRLLDDKLYLEKAYDQIQEKVGSMEDDIRETFLTYPIPRRIILEWEGVS
jgi:tetratricopeptide (TPR) repeat protein